MTTDRERLEAAISEALDPESRHSSTKWNGLRDVLMEIFDLPADDVRCGLISKGKNATNRAQKDVAWQNPRVLAMVVEPGSEVAVDYAERSVLGFAAKYSLRHDDVPRLRSCLLFDGIKLAKVLQFYRPGQAAAGATVVDVATDGEDEGDVVDDS